MLVKFFLFIYDLLWYIALPFVILFLFFKGRRLPGYRKRLQERFGFYRSAEPVDIWFHAVSVGEVVAASALVEACLKSGYRVLVTTMTPTGSEQVKRMFAKKVFHQFCPYDFSFALHAFLKDRQPKLLMVFETELWPGMLARCHQHSIPVFLANARISNRSYPRYLKTVWLWKHILQFFTKIYAQSPQDILRFQALGAQAYQIELAGNLKFKTMSQDVSQLAYWRHIKSLYPQKRFLVMGSTHSGEEEMILDIWGQLQPRYPEVILVIVPRHPERFEQVFQIMKQRYHQGFARLSTWEIGVSVHTLLVDEMGVLCALYSIADFAFVGGSLVPVGGHNILEPLAFGVPVITGPYMYNQQDLVKILQEEQAISIAANAHDLSDILELFFVDEGIAQSFKKKSLDILSKHQGALEKHLQGIRASLAS